MIRAYIREFLDAHPTWHLDYQDAIRYRMRTLGGFSRDVVVRRAHFRNVLSDRSMAAYDPFVGDTHHYFYPRMSVG